ncbi:MAG: SMP-30/gluconolactonase/LRE family protein [Saonia sp.]
MRKILPLLYFFIVFACYTQTEVIAIEYDSTLIPEGIAIDEKEEKIYLSSIHQKKIIETTIASGESKDFISSGEHYYKSGVGITVKDNHLFALGSEKKNKIWSSILLVFDLNDGSLMHTYQIKDTTSHLMNDLAISEKNEIFISDTEKHCVYKLNYPEGNIEVFLKDEQIQYPNGIAISDDGTKLFVDSWSSGLRIVDIRTKHILNSKHMITKGIDGLKYYKGNLYAIINAGEKENHGLLKIELSKNEESITATTPLLMNHEKMNIPTTFAIGKEHIYMLANSQIDNLNQDTNQIIDKEKLTHTFVLKYKIN